jgi:hypothetical protein
MKYLVSIALLLTMLGCESQTSNLNSSTPGASATDSSPDEVTASKKLKYLDQPLKSMVNQRGLYRLVRSGGLKDDPDTSTGKSIINPVIELAESTERIPLIKGAQMYLQYRLWYLPERPAYIDLKRVLRHPEMKLPDGSVATGSEYMMKQKVSVNQAIGYTGYGLDEDYELVEGDWVFEVWYQGEKMIDQKFTTYWPDKEELATLEPLLGLGNDIMTKVESKEKGGWPVILVGEKEIEESVVLSEMKRAIDDPNSQKPPR